MKLTQTYSEKILPLVLVLWIPVFAGGVLAQGLPGRIEVRGLMGSASYSLAASAPVPLGAGMVVPIGAVVKTVTGSALDLSFSNKGGVVRLLQNSTLSLDRFSASDATPAAVMDVQLNLMEGTMVGFDKKLSNPSRFQIKVSRGIVDMDGAKYRLDAQGFLVLLEGEAVVVFVPASGDPVPFPVKTPPPGYFSPVEGVRPAPVELVREVVLQTKGQLRGR